DIHLVVVRAAQLGRARLHRHRCGARSAHRAGGRRGQRRPRAVARARRAGHRRHRRHARPALRRQGAAALVRRGAARQHRRLPDVRLRADGAAPAERLPARGQRRHRRRGAAARRLELPVLPGRRQDRRPLLPRFPQLLERRGVLRDRDGPAAGRRLDDRGGVLPARARAGRLHLPVADAGAAHPDPGLLRGVAGALRRHRRPAAVAGPAAARHLAVLHRLLLRSEPVPGAPAAQRPSRRTGPRPGARGRV
ncbi:MAG: Phosphatidylcholine synthase, partial [uncultured Frankineae bacterium]